MTRHRTTWSETVSGTRSRELPLLLGAVLAILLALPVAAQAGSSAGSAGAAPNGGHGSIAIECGGYDHTGELVHPEALEVHHAPLATDGTPEIPEICGGYTEDGTFIGDE